MEGNKILNVYIDKYAFLQCLSLTDRDGIVISSAYIKDKEEFVETQGYMIFTAAFSQANANLAKLK